MKPGRSPSLMREVTTVVPGSKSGSRPDREPEPHQTPITQPEPGPEKTPAVQPASETLQRPNTQQEPASQQRSLIQQEPLAQTEAELQQEPRAQQQSALQQELLAPQESARQQSPPIQRVPSTHQETASQQGPGSGKGSRTQQEPEVGEGRRAPSPAQQEVESIPLAPADSTSQENPGQSDPTAQQTAPVKSQEGASIKWGFLSKLHELSLQQPASQWKTFLDWVTDLESESDSGCPFENDSPAMSGGTVTQGMTLAFKRKPGYEDTSGCGGTSAHGQQTWGQNHRHYQDTSELSLEEWGAP